MLDAAHNSYLCVTISSCGTHVILLPHVRWLASRRLIKVCWLYSNQLWLVDLLEGTLELVNFRAK